jgi:DNA invertase Pin-like site-specific DNA recombinase
MAAQESLVISRTLLRRLESHPDFPLEALEAVVSIRRRLDDVERDAVTTARAKGATWDDIAAAIGVTRQAVYQKYRNNSHGSARRDGRGP